MALVRILVDGYSLLHNWPELASGKPRHSAAAREELITQLTQYHDACGTPITIVFDGAGGANDFDRIVSSCLNFIQTVAEARADLEREIKHYNQSERLKFKRAS